MSDITNRGAFGGRAFRSTRMGKGVMATMPIVLAGAMTVSMNLTGPLESASAASKRPVKARSELAKSLREITTAVKSAMSGTVTGAATAGSTALASAALASATTYTVTAGDTVSSIAGRYGLSTASVLAANGLSWKSLIFPGQVLKLSATASPSAAPARAAAPTAAAGRYTIQKGDTISEIAARFGVSTQAVLSANGLSRSSIIYGGQTIAIPAGGSAPLAIRTVASVTPVAPAPAASTHYTIRAGDTISSIARSTGISVAEILSANGLSPASIIYAGRTLTIPGSASLAAASASAPALLAVAGSVTPLTAEMEANARTIIQVGRRLGVPDRGIAVALTAAAQESGLRNLSYGDRDSVGIFQQRPSAGWGSAAQLQNVDYAAQLFYGGPKNPNKGNTRGLLEIPGWQSMTLGQAAQAVQISAFPDAYAKWETSAWAWLARDK